MKTDLENQPLQIAGELRNIESGSETVIDVLGDIDKDGKANKRITFGKRLLQPEQPDEPAIARALARNHEFHSVDEFGQYIMRECEIIAALALADVERETIRVTLDEGNENDREFVEFKAKSHPLFKPWKELIGRAIPVLEFSLFVMQYRSAVIEPDGRELALTFSQIKAAKTITKQTGVGPRALNGVMIETMINGTKHDAEVELPEQVKISAPLYLDTDPVEITFDLLVTDTPQGIVVFVTAPLLEEALFNAFGQFVNRLKKNEGLMVGFGKVQERSWAVIK